MIEFNLKKALLFFALIAAVIIIVCLAIVYISKEGNRANDNLAPEKTIFNPSLLGWEQVSKAVQWEGRDSHAVLVFKNKIWLMGGLDGTNRLISPGNVDYGNATHFSDVWSSEDGVNWQLVTDKAPWGGRRSIQVVDFKNKMWLMGGWGPEIGYKNNIWSSEDGIKWKLERSSANWPSREGHQILVFQNKMWLIGGVKYAGQQLFNDVWSSEDGVNWERATDNAGWSPRWDFSVTVFDNKIWLTGGMAFEDKIFNDVWSSEDGVNWLLVKNNLPFGIRQGSNMISYKGNLWILGRLNIPLYGNGENDVWYSSNGIDWQKTEKNPLWTGREDSGAVVFKDKIWIIGGMDKNWEWKNDVWYSI